MPGGRGGRGGGPMPREVQVSKKLSWLLRHGAEKEGLTLGKGGYINLAEVLNSRNIRSLKTTLDEIKSIVASNEKQRFSLIHTSSIASTAPDPPPATDPSDPTPAPSSAITHPDTDPTNYLIRANQGHSISMESSDLLKPLTLDSPEGLPAMVVHGTGHDAWPLIVESGGLKRMGRNHVHFATGVPEGLRAKFVAAGGENVKGEDGGRDEENGEEKVETLPDDKPAPAVLSGMRNSSTILIYVSLKKALEAGIKFWMSENGVVLSEGDAEKGLVGTNFFEKVEERGGRVLVKDGKVVAEPDSGMLERAKARGGRGGRGRGRGGRGRSGGDRGGGGRGDRADGGGGQGGGSAGAVE